jgi:hypothetical protein
MSRDKRQGSAQQHTALLADLLDYVVNDAGQYKPCCRPRQHHDIGADGHVPTAATTISSIPRHLDDDAPTLTSYKLSAGFN